jgi:hypothetical protein
LGGVYFFGDSGEIFVEFFIDFGIETMADGVALNGNWNQIGRF